MQFFGVKIFKFISQVKSENEIEKSLFDRFHIWEKEQLVAMIGKFFLWDKDMLLVMLDIFFYLKP